MAKVNEEALLQAIHSEIQARNAYELLAGRIEAEPGRSVISAMAKEEEDHRSTLAARYKKLTGNEYQFDSKIKAKPDLSFVKSGGLKRARALEALNLALSAEMEAISYYAEALSNAESREDKSIFKTLLKFEKKHKKILTKEIEKMQKSNHWGLSDD